MLEGGCFCGAVRYATEAAPFHLTNCHCTICRRTSGAPFVAWFSVPRSAFRFVRGEPNRLHSSDHGTRTFCGSCGSPLTFASSEAPEEIDVTTCTLDDPEALPPQDHTFVESRVGWVKLGDRLPQHVRGRVGS